MQYLSVPRADATVSRIAVGCEQLGGTDWGEFDRGETARAVARAAELGVNVFDTADVYSLGESERVLAATLGARRHEMFIVTKGGVRWELRPGETRARTSFDLSPEYLKDAVENSLRRLALDAIPLYLLHAPDANVPLERSLEAVTRLKETGKIRAIGLSNFPLGEIRRAAQMADIAAVELRFNLLERGPAAELLPWCREQGIAVLAYGPLAEGLLAGSYDRTSRFDESDRRRRLPHFQGEALSKNLDLVGRIRKAAARHSKSAAQIAVNWVLSHDAVACAIVGIKNVKQAEEAAGCVGWEFDPRSLDD